jgi:hypothetical protein
MVWRMGKVLKKIFDYFYEIFVLVKVMVTSFWFWLPPVFFGGLYFSFWLMFVVHPVCILLSPSILLIILIYLREKRGGKMSQSG